MAGRDQERIWEHFQGIGADTFAAAEPRYAAVVRVARRRLRGGSGRALNIGAGSGGVERRLLALGWEVATLDLTAVAVERLRALGVDARQGRAEAMPFADGCFDVVIASEVLEHISSSERSQAISEVARILRSGGWFIGTVPYRENLRDNEAVCPACGHVFHRWGHADSFDKRKLVQELSAVLVVRRCRSVAFVDWRDAIGKGPRACVKAVAKCALGLVGEGVVYPSLFFEAEKPRAHCGI
jgi:SAM-dependent methyltransferase